MRAAISVLALLVLTTPGFAAQTFVYKGTLAGKDIVLEITDPADGPVVGRYSYIAHGADIPLQSAETTEDAYGAFAVTEEAPCAPGLCPVDADYNLSSWPVAATWNVIIGADGFASGTWQAKGKSKTLDISLEEVGGRQLPEGTEHTPMGLTDSAFAMTYTPEADFSADTDPYDFIKMDVKLTEGPLEELDGSHFHYVTDPRTKFAFPRIVDLVDSSDVAPVNAALAIAHANVNASAFGCLSQAYAGFGGREDMLDMGFGTLAGFDEESLTVTYLSPTLTSWSEGGSTFCGGAYPDNHLYVTNLETKTGAPLAIARVFKDWVAVSNNIDYDKPVDQAEALAAPGDYTWQAGQPLIDYVLANRVKGDAADEADCGIDDLIASNLGVNFLPGDKVTFDLQGLPHVVFGCGQDLLTVQLADIPELLAPTAAEVFPSLAE